MTYFVKKQKNPQKQINLATKCVRLMQGEGRGGEGVAEQRVEMCITGLDGSRGDWEIRHARMLIGDCDKQYC